MPHIPNIYIDPSKVSAVVHAAMTQSELSGLSSLNIPLASSASFGIPHAPRGVTIASPNPSGGVMLVIFDKDPSSGVAALGSYPANTYSFATEIEVLIFDSGGYDTTVKLCAETSGAVLATVPPCVSARAVVRIINGGWTLVSLDVGRQTTLLLGDSDHTIDTSAPFSSFALATPTANRTIHIKTPGTDGEQEIEIARGSSGAFPYTIRRYGEAAAIVTLSGSTRATARIRYVDLGDGAGPAWHLCGGFGGSAGAHA